MSCKFEKWRLRLQHFRVEFKPRMRSMKLMAETTTTTSTTEPTKNVFRLKFL